MGGNRRRLEGNRRRLERNRRRLEGNRRRLERNRRRLEGNRRRLEGNRRRLEGNQRRLEGNRRRLERNRRQWEVTDGGWRVTDGAWTSTLLDETTITTDSTAKPDADLAVAGVLAVGEPHAHAPELVQPLDVDLEVEEAGPQGHREVNGPVALQRHVELVRRAPGLDGEAVLGQRAKLRRVLAGPEEGPELGRRPVLHEPLQRTTATGVIFF